MKLIGIDLCRFQGNVDWSKVSNSEIDFALIKAGYGNDISQKDDKFDYNVKQALSKGIHVGSYWFSYAVSVADAQKEAEVFNQILAPYKGKLTFPVAYDFEYDSVGYFTRTVGRAPTNAEIDSFANAFLDRMKSYGWFVNIYTGCDYIRSGKFSVATTKKYDVWLADYCGAPDYPCYIQQTGDKGHIAGIANDVDTDVCFRDYPTMIKAGGYNGFQKPAINVKSDTTLPVYLNRGESYTAKITADGNVSISIGTSNVANVNLVNHTGNDYFYKFTGYGKAGSGTGIFANGQKLFALNIK